MALESMSSKYDEQKFVNGQMAIRRAMTQLREHFESVEISCYTTDSQGAVASTTMEWSEEGDDDEDDEDDKIKPK